MCGQGYYLPGSASCQLLDDSGDETSPEKEEDTQGHLVYLMSVGRTTSPCIVETIRGLVLRLLVIQGT